MTDHPDFDPRPPRLALTALFLKFLGFGAAAFGGPVAQIAMLRAALVEEERWITPGRFNRLLAVLQVLPGPEAHELCVHLGMIARGRWGGLLAGLGFMLPGFVLMLIVGWAYTRFIVGVAGLSAVLLGVQVAVLAIIARAVIRIGQHVLHDRWLIGIALVAFVATVIGVPFWLPLVLGGLAYAGAGRRWWWTGGLLAVGAGVALIGWWFAGMDRAAVVAAAPVTLVALFVAGLKGGLLTFGGAYTAIPYVRGDTVGRGWIDDATFLDGIALSGVLPAPLVIFATFVGYVAGGIGGALAITAGMFLPAFAFSLILFERLEAIVENPALHRLLAGVAAAVVGIIVTTLFGLAGSTAATVPDGPANAFVALVLFALTFAIVWRVKARWITPALLAAGGIVGWLAFA